LDNEQIIQSLKVALFNYDLLTCAVAEISINDSQVLEKTHQLASVDAEYSFIVALDIETGAQLLNGVLV